MSGTFQHRVNRLWDANDQADMSVPAFFWEWLNFVQDHAGLSFVGYGVGKSSSGTTPPISWIDNFDPTSDANPYTDNSWFAFEASNADNLLFGAGNNPWQAKIQMTTTTGFDDCNAADTDYDQETETWSVCLRCSVAGGWENSSAFDFQPAGGEDASKNVRMMSGQDVHFILNIIGDDDTLFWDGACFTGALSNADARSRGGYLGLLARRSSAIDYPFIMSVGRMSDNTQSTGELAINRCRNDSNDHQWYKTTGTLSLTPGLFLWPTYSLWSDGTAVEGESVHAHDCWHPDDMEKITPDPVTGDILIPACLAAQWQSPNKYAILGELRLIGATGYQYDLGTVVGTDSDWRQFCYNAVASSGMLMMWPSGTTSLWT